MPSPTPTPAATPVAGKSVGATPVSGTVTVRLPGSSKFVPLASRVIPNGASVDATKGRVTLTTVTGDKASFYSGRFKVTYVRGFVELVLEGALDCSKRAKASAKKKKEKKLWGDGKGKFRVRGKYGSAAIRGTRWLTADRCNGTFVDVRQGVVEVRDFVAKRTRIVRAGNTYLAKAKR